MPKHARTEEIEASAFDESFEQPTVIQPDEVRSEGGGKKGKKHLTLAQKKSKRMRNVLIVVIILILLLIGALGYFTWLLLNEAQNEATQQTLSQGTLDVDQLKESETDDSAGSVEKQIEAPELSSLLGLTQDEALDIIGRGATVASTVPVEEEGNPIKTSLKITLTDEPGDTRSGTPTVYLDLDANGAVISTGYSASALSLGFGSLSFSETIETDRIIEKTLKEAGLTILEGSVDLPRDKDEYNTYGSDGNTLMSSSYTFADTVEQDGVVYEWTVILKYDYTSYNASGNPVDTTRQIYVGISQEGVTAALVEAEALAEAAAQAQAEAEAAAAAEAAAQAEADAAAA